LTTAPDRAAGAAGKALGSAAMQMEAGDGAEGSCSIQREVDGFATGDEGLNG